MNLFKWYNYHMKQLFTIDSKDYDPEGKKFYRPSVRGIIFDKKGNVAMIYSRKGHFYKFPGGGIEGDEDHMQALAREIREETGMSLIPESVNEFGEVLKIQGGNENGEDVIHIQQNYYYTCKVEKEIGKQNLDSEEKSLDFVLKFVPIDEAMEANATFKSDNPFHKQMAERERKVLEIIKNTQ